MPAITHHGYEGALANHGTPAFSWHVLLATSASKHATHRTLAHLYAGLFSVVRGRGILRSSDARSCIDRPPAPRGWLLRAATPREGDRKATPLTLRSAPRQGCWWRTG